jgi:hypothetical protein
VQGIDESLTIPDDPKQVPNKRAMPAPQAPVGLTSQTVVEALRTAATKGSLNTTTTSSTARPGLAKNGRLP